MALDFVMHANGNNLIVLINIAGSSQLIRLNSTPKIVVIQPSINAQTFKLPNVPSMHNSRKRHSYRGSIHNPMLPEGLARDPKPGPVLYKWQ